MLFTIDPSLLRVAPYIGVAVVRIRLAPTAQADLAVLDKLKADSLNILLHHLVPSQTNADLEKITSVSQWLQVYKTMGLKPKKTKPTHFALATRLLKDKKWPRAIGPLVDTYLCNQIKHLMPHGGYDVAALTGGTIELVTCDDCLPFQPLGVQSHESDRLEQTTPGEVIYRDVSSTTGDEESIVLTRYWNHRDAEPTKIVDSEATESSTQEFVLFIESVDASPEGRAKLQATADDLEAAYRAVYGDGSVLQSYVRVLELDETMHSSSKAVLSLDW